MFENIRVHLYLCIYLRVLVFNTIPYQMMFVLFDSNMIGNAYPSGAHEFVSVFCYALCIPVFSSLCSSLYVIVVLYVLVIALSVLFRLKVVAYTTGR